MLRVLERIREEDGFLPFSIFMDMALFDPEFGYYTASMPPMGKGADFITSPEVSPLFGRAIARAIIPFLRATEGDILELGPGTGALACAVAEALSQRGEPWGRFFLCERSESLKLLQKEKISCLARQAQARFSWVDACPSGFRGVVLANEFFDALPVEWLAWKEEGLCFRGVAEKDGTALTLAERLAPSKILAAVEHLGISPPYLSEVGLAGPRVLAELCQRMEKGAIFIFDYGYAEEEYYAPERNKGTLMCHFRGVPHEDPLLWPGLGDITAHVDFTALARVARGAGFLPRAYTSQARFLIESGILEELGAVEMERYPSCAAQVKLLLHPGAMGERFRALVLEKP